MKCPAPPHDLLKIICWPHHDKAKYARRYIPEDVRARCPELWRWIRHHGARKKPSYHIPDILSAVIARPSIRYRYWPVDSKWCKKDPFLIKVFGDIVYWPAEKRLSLFNKILDIYRREGETGEAHAKVNELLSDYPQDSRFPVVGLKVHHYLSWALRERQWALMGKDANKLYIVHLSIPPPPLAHRLKSLREYVRRRRDSIWALMKILEPHNLHPLRIGDDLYLVLSEHDDLDGFLDKLTRTRLDVDIEVYEYELERKEVRTQAGYREYRVVSRWWRREYSLGGGMKWGVSAGSAMWVKQFDEPYVAWINVAPLYDLRGSAEEFVKRAEHVLADMPREEVLEPLESEVPVSPDILVAVAEGYGEFLDALLFKLRMGRENVVFTSFNQSLFIYGLRDPEWAAKLYLMANEVRAKLHISTALTVVVTKPKHPFWHVLRLIGTKREEIFDGVVFTLGGKTMCIKGEDVTLLEKVAPALRGISRGAFYKIVRASKRSEPAVLKFEIKGMAEDGKITRQAANELCWFIDRFSEKYGEKVGDVLPQALRMLTPWTRRERR